MQGYNLFEYCFNNPVNLSDETGNWPRWITAAVAAVATVVAVVATVVSAPIVATAAAAVAVDCHQYTAKHGPNKKYVSPDGHREVIYNSQNEIVLDPRDIGTYNFSPSNELWYSKESLGHLVIDIIPWIIFGNDDNDPGPIVNEIIRLFE